jgi:hypothetical protein
MASCLTSPVHSGSRARTVSAPCSLNWRISSGSGSGAFLVVWQCQDTAKRGRERFRSRFCYGEIMAKNADLKRKGIDLEPDAIERFERAIETIGTAQPMHRTKGEKHPRGRVRKKPLHAN